MPTYLTGNLWDELGKADLLLVTSNATLNSAGNLIMGRGAAKEAADKYPMLAEDAGAYLTKHHLIGQTYGLLLSPLSVDRTRLGLFQVKSHWRDEASLTLIAHSVGYLCALLDLAPGYKRVALNYPGIGNGRRTKDEIEPLLRPLPERVVIYERGEA